MQRICEIKDESSEFYAISYILDSLNLSPVPSLTPGKLHGMATEILSLRKCKIFFLDIFFANRAILKFTKKILYSASKMFF